MFWIILKKEVAELCTSVWLRVWLIVSCLLVTTALSGGHTRYVEKHQEFLDAATRVNTSVQEYDATRPEEDTFKILRQPSVLSSVVYGLEGGIPIYMAITPNGVRPGAAPSANETVLGLFGDFDFLFLTEVVFGLMTALLAANLVSTERERGTLKLLLSHAVPRSTFLLGKAVGGYSVAASIFIVSTLVGVLYVLTDGFPIFQPETALRFSVMVMGALGYLLCVFLVGLLCSCIAPDSIVALLLSVWCWAVISFLIPNTSGIVAELVRPIESERAVYLMQKFAREEGLRELEERLSRHYPDEVDFEWAMANFEDIAKLAGGEWEDQRHSISRNLRRIANGHQNNVKRQESIGKLLSRLSPSGCVRLLLCNLAGTGDQARWRFWNQAWAYHDLVNESVFAKLPMLAIGNLRFPYDMGVKYPSAPQALKGESVRLVIAESAIDVLLLCLYASIVFLATLLVFIRRDLI